jgi:hypothetical protein
MARVQYGPLVTAFIGSIGGITFQRNRSGEIARLRSGTKKQQTSKQSVSSAEFTRFLVLWNFIGLPDQIIWNDFAAANPFTDRFGTIKVLTGINYMMSINRVRELVGLGLIIKNPTPELPPAFDLETFLVDFADLKITQQSGLGVQVDGLMVFATGPISRATTSFRRELKLIHTQVGWNDDPITLTAGWAATYGYAWPPNGNAGGFNIGIQIVTVDFTSGITGVAVQALGVFTVTP